MLKPGDKIHIQQRGDLPTPALVIKIQGGLIYARSITGGFTRVIPVKSNLWSRVESRDNSQNRPGSIESDPGVLGDRKSLESL